MFESLKVALGKIRSEHGVLIKRRDKAMRRREDLHNLPINKEDFIESMAKGINAHSVEYFKRMQQTVDDLNSKGNSLKNSHYPRNLPYFSPWSGSASITSMALFALLGDEIKKSLSKIVADLDWPKSGPPIATREKEIAKLDQEISKIDIELGELKTAANQSGIQLTGNATTEKGSKMLSGEAQPDKYINTGS